MKRILHIIIMLLLALGLCGVSPAQQAQPVLTSFDFTIVGVGLGVSPDYQAVPKGINTQVNTTYTTPGFALSPEVLGLLPKDYTVIAELTGPAYQSPLTLTAAPGNPFKLPTLSLLGKYTLANIRLLDGAGTVLFSATPQAVTIESIGDPLITNVQTRQLTLQEIQDRGVVVDSSNFTAYDFTVALGTESNRVPISFPVIIPNTYTQVNPEALPPATDLGIPPPVVSIPPPPELPANTSFEGFVLQADPDSDISDEVRAQLPPIPGVVVIPNNIGFLNQYFSALLLVTNGAPGQSNLVVKDLKATISLPVGKDTVVGTNDDPLKMAVGAGGIPFPSELPVMNAGPDGKAGTPDDISLLHPAESGQADFTIEGKKEGTHKIDFDISAILEGLPIGPVRITGKATGAVLVRNPTFSITFSHPSTIRSGEGYEIFVTITNTSKTNADLVSLHLDSQALSGARMAADETADRLIQTIAPGSSATISYRLVAQRTGKVTATAMSLDDNLKGRFTLRAGVGDRNIPLSPDSLIIPYTGSLPADLVNAAVGLLGQAWSVATAPAGALPSDVLPIAKQLITARANDLSETGIRILMGDAPAKAVADLAFDFLGAENADRGFDDLRRKSAQGLSLDLSMAAVFREAAAASSVIALQQGIAERATSRPGHISVVTSESPVRVMITDGANNKIGGLTSGNAFREIPYADQLRWSAECGAGSAECTAVSRSTLSLITKIDSPSYRVDLTAEAAAYFDLGIVVPDGTGTLRQVKFNGISLPAGARAWVTLLPNTTAVYSLSIDLDNDGKADGLPLSASSVIVVPDLGPSIAAVTQLAPGFGPGGDKHGRNVAVLFSERVTKETAQNIANYSVDENAVRVSYLQASGRMAILLLRDGIGRYDGVGPFPQRFLTVSGITDLKQNVMDPGSVTLPITPRVTGPAAVVRGTVRSAQGSPVPGALVRLLQLVWIDQDYSLEQRYVIFSEKPVKADGTYQFDYVFQNDDPAGPFMIESVNLETGESSQLTTNVQSDGQQLTIDLFMKARGTVTGTVLDAAGSAVAHAAVLIKTLNDGRTYSTTADASGGFSFTGLRVGPFSLKVVSMALLAEGQTMGTLPDDGSTAVQNVTIYPVSGVKAGNVTGKVLESDGRTPRGGVVVIVNGQNYQNWTRTAADGAYSFTGVYIGQASISARDELTGMNAVASGQVSENTTAVFNIILKGMGSVEGMVQREDGLSPAGFTVIADGGSVQRLAVTDQLGKFRFDNLPTGTVTVRLPDPRRPSSNLAVGTVTILAAGDTMDILLWLPARQLSTGSITGSVKRRDGSTWSNAEVWLIVDPAAGTYKPYTAVSGTFVIPDPGNPNDILSLGSHQLVVREGAEIANATASLWYDGQNAVVELKAAAIGTVSGTVFDEGSNNLPTGADVTLISAKPDRIGWLRYDTAHPVTVKSDPQTGRYSFTGVYAGSFTVSATNVLRPVPAVKSGALATNGENTVVDLYLKDTKGTISGTVLLPDGSPASDGVSLSIGGGLISVSTNTAGIFHFPFIPAGNYELTAEEAATMRRAKVSVAVPAGKDVPVTIKLLGKGSITVNVVDGNGAAVAASAVNVKGTAFPNDLAGPASVLSGETVTFGNLSEGVYAISAVDHNNRGGRTQVTIPADQAQVAVTVQVADSGTITGRFLKADGTSPVAGGQIILKNAYRNVLAYALSSTDPADAGAFRFDFVPIGPFIVEGYDPASDRRGVGGGNLSVNNQIVTADVIVTPRGTVKGTVLNNAGTVPVDDASVSVNVEGVSSWSYNTVTAPDGSFTFAGVPAGKITVYASDKTTGRTGRATGTLTYEGETVKTDIRLQATGSIEGTVYLPTAGNPNATNASVTVNGVTKQVDTNGSFLFTNLPSGSSFSVIARELGEINRAGTVTASITADGETAHADIILKGIGTVEGYVYDPLGKNKLLGASVYLYATGTGGLVYSNPSTGTNLETGIFRFTNVPVGTFTLRATYQDELTAASASGALTAEGEVVTVDLKLGDIGSVTGTVLLAGSSTPAAAGGAKYTGCGLTFNGTIGTDGRFIFDGVPLCASFDIYVEHERGAAFGLGRYHGALTTNGQVLDIGTIYLDDDSPAVTGATPVAGTTNVSTSDRINYPITVSFSEPVAANSVASSVYLTAGSVRSAGTVTLSADGKTATFTPMSGLPLSGFTVYTIVATTGVTDLVGRPLAAAFSSTFTTVDVTPPTVVSISPAFGDYNVPVDANMRVTFSEAVDMSAAAAIRLSLNEVPQNVTVTFLPGNTVAVVSKPGGMLPNATYILTVSGVTDPAGNRMDGTVVSRFSTLDTISPTISSLTYPPGSGLIQGNKVTVTSALTDTDVAFVDFFVNGSLAATVSNPPYSFELLLATTGSITVTAAAQDKTGNRTPAANQPVISLVVEQDHAPQIAVTWPDSVNPDEQLVVTVLATDDLSIREIDLVSTGTISFIDEQKNLSGTPVSRTFSKLVPSTALLGNSIMLTATARDSGGKSAQDTKAVIVRDTKKPSVSISSPGQTNKYKPGQQGMATVTASDAVGVTAASCTATGAGAGSQAFVIDPAQKQVSRDFTFTVSSGAAQNAYITINCDASDAAGNTQSAQTMTLYVGDAVPPIVTSSSLAQNAVNVPIDAAISITFSEPMKLDTLYGGTNGTVTLQLNDGSIVEGAVSLNTINYQVVTFTPSPALDRETTYTLTITTGVADQADNYLEQNYVLSFTTVPIDRMPPTVVSINPASANVSVGVSVVATFSEALNTATVTKDSFVLSSSTGTVAGVLTFASANSVVTLRPNAQLEFNKDYTVLLTTQITDSTGNALASNVTSTFRTGAFSITSPRAGSALISGSTTTLTAVASNIQGITKVKFSVNDVSVGEKNGAPYSISYTVPTVAQNDQLVISAEAFVLPVNITAPSVHVIILLPDNDDDGDGLTNAQEIAAGSDPLIVDTDGDGLTDYEEVMNYHTDPTMPDTDGDGLTDYEEVMIYHTDPLKKDTDGDGLTDYEEVMIHHTDPIKPDTDGDGLLDGWEVRYGLNPLLADTGGTGVPDGDKDIEKDQSGNIIGDGIPNKYEQCLGLDPTKAMTDNITHDGQRDDDRDGLKNIDEITIYHTNPCLADTDGDGVIDSDEINVLLTNPNDKNDLYGKDLVLNAKTIRIEGKALFSSLTLTGNSTITTLGASITQVSKADIEVTGTLSVSAGSKIDVSGKGYLGARQGLNSAVVGMTRDAVTGGPTTTGGSWNNSGGSYGGTGGGNSAMTIYSNTPYGDVFNPFDVGSGGGGSGGYHAGCACYIYYPGGNGGGSLRIKAGDITLNGSIAADGNGGNGGAGSGGGIWIETGALSGTGSISAKGGASGYGGGGGRIAIYYNELALSRTKILASGGKYGTGSTADNNGGAGTVYLKSAAQTYGEIVVNNDGTDTTNKTPVPGGTYDNVEISGGASIRAIGVITPQAGMTISNSKLDYTGHFTVPGNLTINNSQIKISDGLSVHGDMILSGSTATVSGSVTADGSIELRSGSVLMHSAATTTTVSLVSITTGTLLIDSNSRIDVIGLGYLGGFQGYIGPGQTGNQTSIGMTRDFLASVPTPTTKGGSPYSGSYAGVGGNYTSSADVNAPYGSLTNPDDAGSGGGGSASSYGGNGGGLIRIAVGALMLDGSIVADGASASMAAGSGGGIRIDSATISGTGYISASGGAGGSIYGGGGGRIAVYYEVLGLDIQRITAKGGIGGTGTITGRNGGAGTIYLKDNSQQYGSVIVDNVALNISNQTPIPAGTYAGIRINGGATVAFAGDMISQTDMSIVGSGIAASGSLTVPSSITVNNGRMNVAGDFDLHGSLVVSTTTVTAIGTMSVSGALMLQSQSILTTADTKTAMVSRLNIQAGSIMIDDLSAINVSSKGYLGSQQGNNSYNEGMSMPGIAGSTAYAGGSYGGIGGAYNAYSKANVVYGDISLPDESGSGGGGVNDYRVGVHPGGNGGGLVAIRTGSLVIYGSIMANGGNANYSTNSCGGGGGGGGILIRAVSVDGTGLVSATGGLSSDGGGGGGGRIAVHYETISDVIKNKLNAAGGKSGTGTTFSKNGGAGTIFMKSKSQTYGDLIIDNKELGTTNATPVSGSRFTSMNVTGGAMLAVQGDVTSETGLALTNTQMTISGGLTLGGDLIISGSTVTASGTISVSGKLALLNQTALTINSATTTTVSRIDILAGEVEIDAFSKIDVSGKGYLGGNVAGNSNEYGMTYSPTTGSPVAGSGNKNGGAYGGVGGYANSSRIIGGTYGDYQLPRLAGSGGGGATTTFAGGNGGGIVSISTGTLLLQGIVSANGMNSIEGYSSTSAAGSGGAILITAKDIIGSGKIRAMGGTSGANGGGGGGRIAIYHRTLSPDMIVSAVGGTGSVASINNNGGAGTIYLKDESALRGDLIIDNGGIASREESTPLRSIGRGQITGVAMNTLNNSSATWTAETLMGLLIKPDISKPDVFPIVDNTITSITIGSADTVQYEGKTYSGVHRLRSMHVLGGANVVCDDQIELSNDLGVSGARLVAREIFANDISIGEGGLLTHKPATIKSTSRLELHSLNTLNIAQTATIDVSARGYLGGYSGDNTTAIYGRTYGNTTTLGSYWTNGGSYGGTGGTGINSGQTSTIYRGTRNPDDLGTGGGGESTTLPGGNGGGLVRIDALMVTLGGKIIADGGSCVAGSKAGGGSGGGVLIKAASIAGGGSILARGGLTGPNGGGGGGGIIAINSPSVNLAPEQLDTSGGRSGDGSLSLRNGGSIQPIVEVW